MKRLLSTFGPVCLGAMLLAPPAFAHGPAGHSHGVLSGLAHPVSGMDHLLAMLIVGLWAQRLGGRAVVAVPAAFVACLIAGFLLGLAQIGLPAVEPMILASVMVLGLMVALALRPGYRAGIAIVGLFALFHGHAHATELGSADALRFGLGFVCATALLHLAGLGLGAALGRIEAGWLSRGLGGVAATLGLAMALV